MAATAASNPATVTTSTSTLLLPAPTSPPRRNVKVDTKTRELVPVPNSAPPASSGPTENYLARAIALSPDLNSYLTLDPEREANKHACQAIMWQVAAWASIVGFAIIAVVACVVCALFAPIYLPLVLGGSIPLMYPIYNLFEYLRGRANAEQAIAFVEQGVARHYQRLNSNQQFSDLFRSHACELATLLGDLRLGGGSLASLPLLQDKPAAPSAAAVPAPANLKEKATADAERIRAILPLIARFAYWKETEQNFQNAVVAETSKKPANDLERRDRNVLMLLFAQQMVMAKVNAAFTAMLIFHPTLKETAVAQACPLTAAPCDPIVLERIKTNREEVMKTAIEAIRDRVIIDVDPKLNLSASRPQMNDGKGSPYAAAAESSVAAYSPANRAPVQSVFRNLLLAWNFEVIAPQAANSRKTSPVLFTTIEERSTLEVADMLFHRRTIMHAKPAAPAPKPGETNAGSGGTAVASAAPNSNPLLNAPPTRSGAARAETALLPPPPASPIPVHNSSSDQK
jgi:hypothetical protein